MRFEDTFRAVTKPPDCKHLEGDISCFDVAGDVWVEMFCPDCCFGFQLPLDVWDEMECESIEGV